MKFQIIALLLSAFTFALPIQQFVDVEELIPQFRLIIEEVLKKDKPTLAEQILKYNGDFAVKFGVRGDMTDDQVAKQLDRAVLRTRIGNGMVGGLVGAGAGAGYVKFENWKNHYKKMQAGGDQPSDAIPIPPPPITKAAV